MRAQLYQRLMEGQDQVAHVLYRKGVTDAVIQDALDTADETLTEAERREDLYLSSLARYVAALGGTLEVRALIGDEQIVVRRESQPPASTSR